RHEVMSDQVTSDMFEASQSRQFGNDQRFFIRSKPAHLATSVMSSKAIWSKLLELERLTSIELDGQVLFFEQMGILQDVDQLQEQFDLLTDLAHTIEKGASLATKATRLR
ncbi:MAG: hypothetical protein ACPGWR_34025, partial [Ardenticatenaceae bacterium]